MKTEGLQVTLNIFILIMILNVWTTGDVLGQKAEQKSFWSCVSAKYFLNLWTDISEKFRK